MKRKALSCLFIAILLSLASALPGWGFVKTTGYNSAEVNGWYRIYCSHALDLENIFSVRNLSPNDDYYEDEASNWIYGLGLGIPVQERVELDLWLYGPFWSIWPYQAKPTGLELGGKVLLAQKGRHSLSLAPAYVSAWGSEEYSEFKNYSDVEVSSRGFQVPLLYSIRLAQNLTQTVSVRYSCDWVKLNGFTHDPPDYHPKPWTSEPEAISHWGINYAHELRKKAVTINLEGGFEFYRGRQDKLETLFTYGISAGTEW